MILIDCPDYRVRGEFLWFGVVLHCSVFAKPFTKGCLTRLRSDLRLIARSLQGPVYAFQLDRHDPLKRKFIEAIGMTFHHRRQNSDGEWADLYTIHPMEVRPFGLP